MPSTPWRGQQAQGARVRLTNLPKRFWDKVEFTETCWLWRGAKQSAGYGHINLRPGGMKLAHRLAYVDQVGEIQIGLELDHLCRTRHCVRPDHLEAVTRLENVRRGAGHGSETHCPSGHPYDEANTYYRDGRHCRRCHKEQQRERRVARRRAYAAAHLGRVQGVLAL